MPTSITLRATKGSALTHNEVDDNFSNLKTTADGALPTASLGTGVATALAVNVGSAGAFVTLNGALGTPSSGTLTNCTGLPAAGVVGTAAILGANTFTATQTITPAANTNALAVTGYSLTGSNAQSLLSITGATNTTGNATIIDVAISNTAWGSTGKFLSFKAGASGTTEVFAVRKDSLLVLSGGATSGLYVDSGPNVYFNDGSTATTPAAWLIAKGFCASTSGSDGVVRVHATSMNANKAAGIAIRADIGVNWVNSSSGIYGATIDASLFRNSAGVIEINDGTAGTYRDLKLRNVVGQTGYSEMVEMTAPSAPAANTVRIYAEDSGGGKTRLMALFPSGAAQQIAIEP